MFTLGAVDFFTYAWGSLLGFSAAAWIGGIAAVGFVALVIRQRRISRRIRRWKRTAEVSRDGLGRIDRRWDELDDIPGPTSDDGAGLAADLDILGRASLYRLTGGAYTAWGKRTLARWLLSPASPSEIVSRQALVAELRKRSDVLLDLRVLTRGLSPTPSNPDLFLAWAEGAPWLAGHPAIRWSARILSVLPLLLIIGTLMGWASPASLILVLAVNLLFSRILSSPAHEIFERVSSRMGRIAPYTALFQFVSALQLDASHGRALQARLVTDGLTAHEQMKRLSRIASFADSRRSTMMHVPLQMLTLSDFHVLDWMERWQMRVGPHVEGWLEALGEFEALIGLATLAHDNPTYTFPRISDGDDPRFEAQGLGHLMLDPESCVTNDVDLGEPGTFLLVTGSNMSGKSSLLRSIGLNAALAGAGGAVFAESLVWTPCVLGTRFRVFDSVTNGVSFFMAELQRLKQIVTKARQRPPGGPPLLFLLDEILQGTNIIERRLAVAAVLKHLIRLGCIGAVSSHDLTLAEAEGLAEHVRAVHFTDHFREGPNGREMFFDYILRPGLAPTTNALELLRLVGLD